MEGTKTKRHFLFISCEEAFAICDKSQYGEASSWDIAKLKLRLFWCRFTKSYVKNNIRLTETIKIANIQFLEKSEREQLHEKFKHQLKNNVQ